ncbi:MAG: hypothetical protein AAGA66_16870 [Bacteroidota bacterium]
MKITIKNITVGLIFMIILMISYSCEQESFEPILTTEDAAGTLINFKAYEINDLTGQPDSAYGRVVFWLGLDGNTLVQLSLYNVPEDVTFQTDMLSGTVATPGAEIMGMYDVTNTGEGYDFGEFSTSKYFVITDLSFYSALAELNAHVGIMNEVGIMIAGGDIGLNSDPVEEN